MAFCETELVAMARSVRLMVSNAQACVSPIVVATDAMGANETDHGGLVMVATTVNKPEVDALLLNSEERSVVCLERGEQILKHPDKHVAPTKPFLLLPSSMWDLQRWVPPLQRRWKYADHITLGEARAVAIAVAAMCKHIPVHDTVVFSLQDNQPCGAAMTKGRSSSWPLNFAVRRKCAAWRQVFGWFFLGLRAARCLQIGCLE